MKVFACKRDRNYGGGLLLVTAKTLDEAYDIYLNNKAYKYMHNRDMEGNIKTEFYPKDLWFEEISLTSNCQYPCVLLEDGFFE